MGRYFNRQHVVSIILQLAADASPERTAELIAQLKRYHPHDIFALFEPSAPQPPQPDPKSKYVRDHRSPYTEGGGLKQRVMKAVLETIICQNCRRAFLSRRRDAKTCSPRCRTAMHRKK
jgi:hypothetical protein